MPTFSFFDATTAVIAIAAADVKQRLLRPPFRQVINFILFALSRDC